MTSAYDLSLAPDSRFATFRQNYTTKEHLMSVYEGIRGHAAITAAGFDMVDSRLSQMSGQLDGIQWAIEDGFHMMADAIQDLRGDVQEGFRNMERVMTWGFARICWEHEQDREAYREILHVLKHPLEAQALEHRERAEKAIANKWWEEAVSDLDLAVQNNKYDYLAHTQLARVLWFEYGQWASGMEHFELAAKYGDAADADAQQKYYAAVAHLHVALLWRMDAETFPKRRQESLAKAVVASGRAFELMEHELPMAVVEHALDLLNMDRIGDAIGVIERAVNADESILLGIETSPDLQGWDEVREWIKRWRERQPVEEVRCLSDEVKTLVGAHWPNAWQETDSLRALRGDLLGGGVATRQILVQAVLDVRDILVDADAKLQAAVASAGGQVASARGCWAPLQKELAIATRRLGEPSGSPFGMAWGGASEDHNYEDVHSGYSRFGCPFTLASLFGLVFTIMGIVGVLKGDRDAGDSSAFLIPGLIMLPLHWLPPFLTALWRLPKLIAERQEATARLQRLVNDRHVRSHAAAEELRRVNQLHEQLVNQLRGFAEAARGLSSDSERLLRQMGANGDQ